MNFLVIGSEGNLGRNLVKTIVNNGDKVVGIDKVKNSSINTSNYKIIEQDFLNSSISKEEFETFGKIDFAIHLAAIVGVKNSLNDPFTVLNTNILLLTKTLEYLKNYNLTKNIIYASSSGVYGGTALDETTRPKYLYGDLKFIKNPYAATKIIGEIILEAFKNSYNFEPICLRFFDMYHETMNYHENVPVFYKFCHDAFYDKDLHIKGNGENKISFLYMEDAANVIYSVAKENFKNDSTLITGTLDVCSENNIISLNSLVDIIEKRLGRKVKVYHDELNEAERKILNKTMAGNSEAIKTVTSYRIHTTPEEGVDKVISYLENKN